MARDVSLTGNERFFAENDIIVSKTDLKGRMTYVNDVFLELASYSEKECLGQPHAMIRHPEMPRCIFKLLWDTIQDGREIFAYVVNRAANGDHYWVLAHVTPSKDNSGNIIGYHSNRRVPDRDILTNTIIPLYKKLLDIENSHASSKEGMEAAMQVVVDLLNENGVEYDEFIAGLM